MTAVTGSVAIGGTAYPASADITLPPAAPSDWTSPKYTLTGLNRSETPVMPELSAGSNNSGATVRQEVWNLTSALKKQVTEVWSPRKWRTIQNCSAGNTAVLSYPDVSNTVTSAQNTPVPAANYAQITSTYQIDMHETAATIGEAAYDLWLGTPASQYAFELMIWVYNVRQRPAGNDTGKNVTIAGNTYRIWDTGGHSTVSLVQPNAKAGSADILAIVNWLIANGYYPAGVGFNQLDFGFEVPSTGGVDEILEVSDYTLVTAAAPGKII